LKVKHDAVENLESKVTNLEKRMKEQERKFESSTINEESAEEGRVEYLFDGNK
jgi:hypothetical protein